MTTVIPLTLQLLILIGLYELTAGLAGLTGRLDFTAMLDEFERSPTLCFITGFMVFALGGTLVIVHNRWTDLPAIIVSAIGWIALVEGLLVMFMPRPLLALSHGLVKSQRPMSLIAALFGLTLILLGFFGRVGLPAQI